MRTSGTAGTVLLAGALACWTAVADVTTGPLAEKSAEDVPALVEALRAPAMGTRWNAALVLGEIGDAAAAPALIECVKMDGHPRVRRRAIDALARIGATDAVPALVAALGSDNNLERRDVARALGALGDKSAVPALIEALKDKEGFVRRDAARALGRLGDRAAVAPLQELAKEPGEKFSPDRPLAEHEESPAARAAVYALMELGDETLVPSLERLLESECMYVRAHALATAGGMGRRAVEAVPLITESLADDGGRGVSRVGPIVRRRAMEALQAIGGSEGVAGLARAFELLPWETGEDRADLQSAASVLEELGDDAALPALRAALEKAQDEQVAKNFGRHHRRLVRDIRQAINALE